jgi:hypothetical protein
VFLLQGEGVHVELIGKTKIIKGVTYSKFETIPDAPITSFETVIPEKEHSLLGAYGVFCEKELYAPTTIVAQNGRSLKRDTKVEVVGCPPKVTITKTKVRGKSVIVALKLSAAGALKIAGSGLRTTTRKLGAGAHTLAVPLSRSGLEDRRKHREIKLVAVISSTGQTGSRSATVKA